MMPAVYSCHTPLLPRVGYGIRTNKSSNKQATHTQMVQATGFAFKRIKILQKKNYQMKNRKHFYTERKVAIKGKW